MKYSDQGKRNRDFIRIGLSYGGIEMKRLTILLVGLTVMLVLGTVTASAQATKTGFVAEESLVPTGPPGKIWVSDEGVQHIRGLPVAGPVWGDDVNGWMTVDANINLDLATGDGTAFGTFVLDIEWDGKSGTFEGRSHWKYASFPIIIDGQGVGHGTGDFEGMHMMANFFSDGARTPLIGTILNPHGE